MNEKFKEINVDFHLECKKCNNKTFDVGISENNELVFTCSKCSIAILALKNWPDERIGPGAEGVDVIEPNKEIKDLN